MHACNDDHPMLLALRDCNCMLQIDSAKEAEETEIAQQQADAIAADNADGLGEDRRKAVLAEAEAATAGCSCQALLIPRHGI